MICADCIGSAFNIKGKMQCPNCRKIEKGEWLYATNCRSFTDYTDDWPPDEELYDVSHSEMVIVLLGKVVYNHLIYHVLCTTTLLNCSFTQPSYMTRLLGNTTLGHFQNWCVGPKISS